MRLKLLVLTTLVSVFVLSQSCFADDIVWTKYTHDISRLQFNNDDSKILTVGSGGIIIFNTSDGSQVQHIPGYEAGEYSADNSLIVAAREQSDSLNDVYPYVDVIDAATYQVIKSIKLNKLKSAPSYEEVIISPDNKTIAEFNPFGLYFIDVETGLLKKTLTSFGDENRKVSISSFIYSKDSKHVIIALWDPVKGEYGSIMFINTSTYNMDYKYDKRAGCLTLSDDGHLLAFNSPDEAGKAVTVMNTQTHEIVGQIPGTASWVRSMVFSPDGQYLAVSDDEHSTKFYKTNDYSLYKTIYPEGFYFSSMDISKDNGYLIGGASSVMMLLNFLKTGVIDGKEILEILYPNPSGNSINVTFELPAATTLSFNLYDMTGVLVEALKTGTYETGTVEENLYLNNIANGTYYLKIESAEFNMTFKVIVNR